MVHALKDVDVVRVRGGRRVADADRAATEEPLEVRLHGRPFAVIMRTPGADRELAAGFLLAERVLRSADDLGTIEYCTDTVRLKADTTYGSVQPARRLNGAASDLAAPMRSAIATSLKRSCM